MLMHGWHKIVQNFIFCKYGPSKLPPNLPSTIPLNFMLKASCEHLNQKGCKILSYTKKQWQLEVGHQFIELNQTQLLYIILHLLQGDTNCL